MSASLAARTAYEPAKLRRIQITMRGRETTWLRTPAAKPAMLAALVGTMLPNMLLSGFIFPLESMPVVLQWISNVVPGRWFVTIARSIMLKGTGLEYLWRETLVLAAMALALLAASTRSFKARLE